MRIVILSGSGNVGKTVVAEHLLAPRLKDALLISFGSLRDQKFSGQWLHREAVSEVFADLLEHEHCLIDESSDATQVLLAGIRQFASVHAFVDYFVVPVTGSSKVQQDTVMLLRQLKSLGVKSNKVRLVFNRIESSVSEQFGSLLHDVSELDYGLANKNCAIFENELFDELAIKKMTIKELLDDPKDYKSLLRENREAEPRQREHWADMFGLKCLAKYVDKNLDDCFAELFPQKA